MDRPAGYVRTLSFNAVADDDGLKTSFTDPTKATSYSWTDMNGAFKTVAEGFGGSARTVSVTTTSKTGNYGTPIVVRGKRNNRVVQESLAIPANGGTTVSGSQPFDFPDPDFAVDVPAGSGGGSMTFGVQDIVAPEGGSFAGFRALSSGNVVVGYQGDYTDTIAALTTRDELVRANRIKASTAVGVVLFWDIYTRRG